jgi:hypothetical protein
VRLEAHSCSKDAQTSFTRSRRDKTSCPITITTNIDEYDGGGDGGDGGGDEIKKGDENYFTRNG